MSGQVTIVTGATGFAAGHLLQSLATDRPVVGWRRPGGRPPDPSMQVTWQAVDLTSRDAVTHAVAEIQPSQIFHLAGAPNVATSWENSVSHLCVNALGTHHLLEAVRLAARPCRVLVVSSGQIYQPSDEPLGEEAPLAPSNPYGLSKLAQDQLALRAAADDGLDIVIARPFNHIGPGQEPGYAVSSFARQIARIERGLDRPELRVGNLAARRDVTDVRDVVRAYIRIMDAASAGRAYNVCSGRAWSMRDLLDELLHLSPARIEVKADLALFRPHDAAIVQGDGTRIQSELNWLPAVRVEETLRDTLEWWRARTSAAAHAHP
jgi:GDP-4-dehydro-6-deoxy-D-mannose reductase